MAGYQSSEWPVPYFNHPFLLEGEMVSALALFMNSSSGWNNCAMMRGLILAPAVHIHLEVLKYELLRAKSPQKLEFSGSELVSLLYGLSSLLLLPTWCLFSRLLHSSFPFGFWKTYIFWFITTITRSPPAVSSVACGEDICGTFLYWTDVMFLQIDIQSYYIYYSGNYWT